MTVRQHLLELRRRAALVVACFVVASAVAYYWRSELISLILRPLDQHKLVYLTPAGGFNFVFSVTVMFGLACSVPVAIYQIYKYIAPALPPHFRGYSLRLFATSLSLLLAGVMFGYFIAVPGAIRFLLSFASEYVQASLTADSYVSFVVSYTLGMGVMFQLPLLMAGANLVHELSLWSLLKYERYFIVGALVLAAIITPTPDVFNMLLVAVPLIALYQVGCLAIALTNRRRHDTMK